MTALILGVFMVAAVAAMPIAHALLVAAMSAAAASDKVPLDLLVQQMVAQVQSFPLIAIPFFMLTGSLMMGGRLGEASLGEPELRVVDGGLLLRGNGGGEGEEGQGGEEAFHGVIPSSVKRGKGRPAGRARAA